MSQPKPDHLKEEFMRLAQGGSTIPEDVKAKLDQLKQEFTQRAEMERRAAQAAWNAEAMANKKSGGGSMKDEGLAKFLKPSKIKERVYHGTGANVMDFKPSKVGAMGPGVYVTTNPEVASGYANVVSNERTNNNPNVLPLHIQARKPFKISHVNNSNKELFKHFDPEGKLSDDEVIALVKKAGYDAIHAVESGEINMLHPKRIKSAIGNRGTYNTRDPIITRSKGGNVSTDGMRYALTMKQGKKHG